MLKSVLSGSRIAPVILCLQVIPLLIFPSSSWTLSTQEWWLPVLLCALVAVALVQLLIRRSHSAWPWYILSFAQGFNIISRLMMLLPHATIGEGEAKQFDGTYVLVTAAAMLLSAFEIWYCELPEVRNRFG
jgi:hypothetical protein